MQMSCSTLLLAPWQHPGGWSGWCKTVTQAQKEKGEERRERSEKKSQGEGQVPATPVKHFSWILSSKLLGCFRGFSTLKSDSWWGLFMLTFKDCHNPFNTPGDRRSPLACLCLCKHVSLLLQHSKGHCSASFVHMSVFFNAFFWGWNPSGLIRENARVGFFCYECSTSLLFSASPLKNPLQQ